MAAAFPVIALGASVVGTGLSAMSALRQGQVSADTARVNAQIQRRQAEVQARLSEREAQQAEYDALQIEQDTKVAEAQQRQAGTYLQASQRAAAGASGIEATGSPLLVLQETASQLELDALTIRRAGEREAAGARDEARMRRWQAEELRRSGQLSLDIGRYQSRAARQAGRLGAFSSLLSGGTSMAKYWLTAPPTS
jgi:hypothetical protein